MSPSYVHRRWLWVAVVLAPLLLARALIPSGFMASVTDGSVHYTLCGDQGSPHSGNSDHSAQGTCPFALSAGAAPLPGFMAGLVTVPAGTYVAHGWMTLRAPSSNLRRAHTPRGPPLDSQV